MGDYRADANQWAADHTLNPDGWHADPEAMLALREAMSDVADGRDTSRTDPLEVARDWWRSAYYRWSRGTGAAALEAAGQMVAVEAVVADVKAAEARACRGGTCHGIMDQCSRHSMEYQNRWGRAANE